LNLSSFPFILFPRQNVLQLLPAAILCFHLLLPSLLCGNLLCFYSPILKTEEAMTFELIVTECPPREVCFKALGRYGNVTALSARGCFPVKSCGKQSDIRLRGTIYAMTFRCCDWPYCNSEVKVKPFYVLITLLAVSVITCL
uniref:UPAR/Ly6 domain-containing protein n=1 Tax=Xiphophorus maculatus TaxID=8083 RepID=A0A3B5Q7T5_XIPMA